MSRRWCSDPNMMPDCDDNGRPLTKKDVFDIKEQYEKYTSAKLMLIYGKESLASTKSLIIQDILFERGLDPFGQPLDSYSRRLWSGR